jgi:hypothetical protein
MLLDAMRVREESYDKAASAEASAKSEAERKADPDNSYADMVDYAQFYRKTLRESCDEVAKAAGEPTMGEIVYYLLEYTWNDCQIWAEEQLKV